MSEEKSGNGPSVLVNFEVKIRHGANAEEAMALQQHLHEVARNTPSIGEIKGENWPREDGAMMAVYTFKSKEAMQEFVRHPEHLEAMRRGKEEFFSSTRVHIASLHKQKLNTYD
jgi:heme-degrading monooxygenase HmoA